MYFQDIQSSCNSCRNDRDKRNQHLHFHSPLIVSNSCILSLLLLVGLFFFCDDWLFEATWMDAASGLKMMFLAATDRDALSVSLLFIIIIFISFSLETLYPLTLLFLSLCLIHYKWLDLLSMPVVHVMSEVCHSGLGPQRMAEMHSGFLTHSPSINSHKCTTARTYAHAHAWCKPIRQQCAI